MLLVHPDIGALSNLDLAHSDVSFGERLHHICELTGLQLVLLDNIVTLERYTMIANLQLIPLVSYLL